MHHVLAAVKALWRRPGASAAALAILVFSIGANTAIFSLLNAVVFRPLPVAHPEQLVALATTIPDSPSGDQPLSLQMFEELRRRQTAISDLFVWNGGTIANLAAGDRHVAAAIASVSGEYYGALGIRPLLGRFIAPADVSLPSGDSNPVAVISFRAWRDWFRADPNVAGRLLRIEGQPFTVIGVEPEGFSGLIIDGSTDVSIPLYARVAVNQMGSREPQLLSLRLYGRLQPGITLRQAASALETAWPQVLAATVPTGFAADRRARYFARRIAVDSAAHGVSFLRQRFSFALRVCLALVSAVLLIACLNLANLSLARGAAHRHETALRAALGATARDLIRLPLVESLLLSIAGSLGGLLVAQWMSRLLLRIAWQGVVRTPLSTAPDGRVLAFTTAIALATGLLFALAPAWFAARTDPIEALKQQSRSVRQGASKAARALLIAQIALSLVLLVAALLFSKTLASLHTVDAGYRRDHLLTLLLFPQAGRQNKGDAGAYYRELAAQLNRLPGVTAVSFSENGPANEFEFLQPVQASAAASPVHAMGDFVGPDFFRTMGMRVLSGREFNWNDDERSVILSRSLADKLFGRAGAIGRAVILGPLAYRNQARVIGVVNSASLWKIESRRPLAFYQPLAKRFDEGAPMVDVRTAADPQTVKSAAERVVRSLGHHYSLRTMTLEERLDSYLTAPRLTALLSQLFGALALLIAALGLYGLLAFQIARRTSELGVRLALGARQAAVIWLVLRQALALAALGCSAGLLASVAAARWMRALLFGVSPLDPAVLLTATLLLLVVALIAGLVQAVRAARLDPMRALRVE